MVELTYTQGFVEKYSEELCVGGRILVIKCQLISCQCVGWPNSSESCSLAIWSEHCNISLEIKANFQWNPWINT